MPSTKRVFDREKESLKEKKTKKQKPDNNDSLSYLPKMHNIYRVSTATSSDLDIYGKNFDSIIIQNLENHLRLALNANVK